ncbi:cell division control protein Cdc6 [Durotheca rogersii]|uniref:cell division control protein Cdc6 n=1 Tax=Durotheca rogersii TaxID=419775 RepID=UPI00221FC9E4|nr:cell division control protein Cdc6 [Durotheca rogersii]KAI5861703.1 cell division control protein Cdc6 [Durotheca rogersii]
MARSTLGKRTRRAEETALEVATKRTRRQTRYSFINDENITPEEAASEDETDDLDEDYSTTDSRVDSPAKAATPSGRARGKPDYTPFTPLTPSTPRFKDALARVPVTPRHRVMSAGKVSKRLFPQTPLTPTAIQTVYHHARQLFSRSADPGQLVGRDNERTQLKSFLDRCSQPNPNGCIYVSGPPGTGKSAMVNEVTQELAEKEAVKKAYINCMSIKSSKDLYATLLEQLCEDLDVSESDAAATVQKLFISRKKSAPVYLVVLDEIDHILTLDLESLYRLFEWSMQKSSRLVLVGIANALDLTDRFLPRLKSRNLKPELLPFLPYSAAQIRNIITTRLQSLVPEGSPLPFMHPAAIELCSRKVSSQTGDLRKAFEICRRAIDLVEAETKQKHEAEIREKMLLASPSRKPLGESTNFNSLSKRGSDRSPSALLAESLKGLTSETAPRVSIAHLNKITAAAFSNGANQRLKTLNLQQKAALCSLMAMEKRNRSSRTSSVLATPSKSHAVAPTVKVLYEAYCQLCTRESVLHPLSGLEFREVVGSLEALSLVSAVDGKTGSLAVLQTPSKRGKKGGFGSGVGLGDERRVASCVGEKELEQAVEGLGSDILKSILSGEALD